MLSIKIKMKQSSAEKSKSVKNNYFTHIENIGLEKGSGQKLCSAKTQEFNKKIFNWIKKKEKTQQEKNKNNKWNID